MNGDNDTLSPNPCDFILQEINEIIRGRTTKAFINCYKRVSNNYSNYLSKT